VVNTDCPLCPSPNVAPRLDVHEELEFTVVDGSGVYGCVGTEAPQHRATDIEAAIDGARAMVLRKPRVSRLLVDFS
jgi:hypothetical protein